MSDYPMLISNKLHSFRNFYPQKYEKTAPYFQLPPLHRRKKNIFSLRVFSRKNKFAKNQ